jgi:hypothetical protein
VRIPSLDGCDHDAVVKIEVAPHKHLSTKLSGVTGTQEHCTIHFTLTLGVTMHYMYYVHNM